jgi:hypothetical protein
MLVFWVNRAVCCNALSIVECKKSYSVFSRSMNIISSHSRDPGFKIMLQYVTCMLPYNYDSGLGSCLNTQTNYSLPRVMTVKNVSRQEAISLTPHLPRILSPFLFPNNTQCETKFR